MTFNQIWIFFNIKNEEIFNFMIIAIKYPTFLQRIPDRF